MQTNAAAGTRLRATQEASRGRPSPSPETAPVDGPAGDLLTPDLCVIGAGSAGLDVAMGAAAFGQRVVVIEKHKMGGDALNHGSIPAKALLAAAKRAEDMRRANVLGLEGFEPRIDQRAIHHHVKSVVAGLGPEHSVERLTGLGIRVILAAGRFIDRQTVVAGDYRIKARRFVIATGSSPAIPQVPGLDDTPFFTSETIFDNDAKLPHLLIIGAGSRGLELAQSYRRLGSEVTVVDSGPALSAEDPELAAVVLRRLKAEGVAIYDGVMLERAERSAGRIRLYLRTAAYQDVIEGSHLLVAAGRSPNLSDLNLEAAHIKTAAGALRVNKGLRTTNRRVYAVGGVTGQALRESHVAQAEAEAVLTRILFRWPKRIERHLAPRATFTDPELAHVGLTEAEAATQKLAIFALRAPYHENERATAERTAEGHIKVLTDKRGRILGATIAGPSASELIHVWSLALKQGLNVRDLGAAITAYPALGEISRRAAERFTARAAANPRLRRIIALLAKLG